jgi:hypothetical protein
MDKEEIDDAIKRQEQEHAERAEQMKQNETELDHHLQRIQDEELHEEAKRTNGNINNSLPYWKSALIDARHTMETIRKTVLFAEKKIKKLEAEKFGQAN